MVRNSSAAFLLVLSALVPVPAIAQPSGPEFRVNTYTTSYQEAPSVAFDAEGRFVVVWTSDEQDGSGPGVFGRRYASGGTPLAGEFRVNTFTPNFQYEPSLAVDASGRFVVVWTSDFGDPFPSIVGRRFASGGAPLTSDFRVNSTTTSSHYTPRVAVDPSGRFVVVWMGYVESGSFDVFGQRFASTGEPLGGQFRVNSHQPDYQSNPAVAMDRSGGFVVVWESYSQDGEGFGVFGQRYSSSGAPVGPEFRANGSTTLDQGRPAVSFDTADRFIVVWESSQDGANGRGIFGQRYSSDGTPLGTEFRIGGITVDDQSHPAVASDAGGGFVASWQSGGTDGSSYGVYARAFRGSGAAAGPAFRVNTYTNSYQVGPSIASDARGDFVIAWHGNLQDGSSTGVFAQRYLPALLKGDVNADGAVDVGDVFYLIYALFAGGPAPMGWGDANGDGAVNVTDVFYLINFIFAGGPAPL